jgi:hypothetical protein
MAVWVGTNGGGLETSKRYCEYAVDVPRKPKSATHNKRERAKMLPADVHRGEAILRKNSNSQCREASPAILITAIMQRLSGT